MPPAKEPVIVTVVGRSGPEITKTVWDSTESSWGQDDGADCIVSLDDRLPVTHWMPYPEPSLD